MYLLTSISIYFILTLVAQLIFGIICHFAFFYAITYARALNTAIVTNIAATLQVSRIINGFNLGFCCLYFVRRFVL